MIACDSRGYEIVSCAVACGGASIARSVLSHRSERRRFRRTQLQKSKSRLQTALAKIVQATSRESRRTRSVRRLCRRLVRAFGQFEAPSTHGFQRTGISWDDL